jgi:hypothetical protein
MPVGLAKRLLVSSCFAVVVAGVSLSSCLFLASKLPSGILVATQSLWLLSNGRSLNT